MSGGSEYDTHDRSLISAVEKQTHAHTKRVCGDSLLLSVSPVKLQSGQCHTDKQ